MTNSRYLAFCKVVFHEKLLFDMCVTVAMFLSSFSAVGRKETYGICFENMSSSNFNLNFENIFSLIGISSCYLACFK